MQELGWGTQADADGNGANVRTVLGFSASGPFDGVENPILSVIATNAGFDSDFYAFAAFIYGQANPNDAPQITFDPVINADSISTHTSIPLCLTASALTGSNINVNGKGALCLTASALTGSNITVALLPCVNYISASPVPTQIFEWISTDFVTYGFAFVGDESAENPLDSTKPTDYVRVQVGAYLSFDFVPGRPPPSMGHEPGLILELADSLVYGTSNSS
ncbi:hypothetical protein C8R44DRAFT_866415 [Mycena epipterygia]|nr:hypothetical protein C8R44DRAFT_866415 [Mycena epipterygia]